MLTGTIKSYNAKNAFGFIIQDDGNEDLFFFKTAFNKMDNSKIEVGQKISYVVAQGKKGPQAAKAEIID